MAVKGFNYLPPAPAPVRAIEKVAEVLQNILPVKHGDDYLVGRNGKTGRSKRIFDVVGATAIAPFAIPTISVLAGIKLAEDGHNPFFTQKRVGKQKFYDQFPGIFEIIKIRSMKPSEDGEDIICLKQKNDPRVTPFGNFLRTTSLDELTQFMNVLYGNMSLAGPRPVEPQKRLEIAEETALYDEQLAMEYLKLPETVLPGMFGDEALHGRALLFSDKKYYPDIARLGVEYRQDASLVKDAELVIGGLYVILRGHGAY